MKRLDTLEIWAAWPWVTITKFPKRLWRFFGNLFLPFWMMDDRTSFNYKQHKPGIGLYILYRWWKIGATLIDLLGIWELWDALSLLVKWNSRKLTPYEQEELEKVFGDSIDYWRIRIDENSWMARLGAKNIGAEQLGFVLFHRINFTRKLNCEESLSDMSWLVHEVTHIAQKEALGSIYITEALYAQRHWGYSYCPIVELPEWELYQFNLEQQGELARHYYQLLRKNSDKRENYRALIQQIRKHEF